MGFATKMSETGEDGSEFSFISNGAKHRDFRGDEARQAEGRYVIIAGIVRKKSSPVRDRGSRKSIERHVIREDEERAGKNIRSERN